MTTLRTLATALAAAAFALPALAADITVEDAYARSASPMAKSGAAFMILHNAGATDDRLVSAASDAAMRVELHTHKATGDGVMQMMEVEDGFVVPAGGTHALARGGDHVMLMGLAQPMSQGDTITVTLTFETAGEITVEIPVDLERAPDPGMGHGMQHGQGQPAGN